MIVDKLKHYYRNTKEYFTAKPKMLIPVAALVFLILFTIFESGRAIYYQKSVRNYKNSVAVLDIRDTVDKLNFVTQDNPPAIYCDLQLEGLLQENNEAYQQITENNQPGNLVSKLREQVKNAGSPPAFNSILQFVPNVRHARDTSQEIHGAIKNISSLTTFDVRSEYCINLSKVLSKVYFLPDIDSPEGVSALSVGQLENFQVNVSQAQKSLLIITPPPMFTEQHIEINNLLNTIALNLRENAYKYDEFSRRIEQDVQLLDKTLDDIRAKSIDLQSRPGQIAIQAKVLE